MDETRNRRPADRSRTGFSLIEVALALIVAAGGLLAIFGVFPVSLRQSSNSRADMGQMTFAATVLETIAGNIRTIDRISVWNDPEQFWNVAVGDTGLPTWGSRSCVSGADMYQQYQSAIDEGDTYRTTSGKTSGISARKRRRRRLRPTRTRSRSRPST